MPTMFPVSVGPLLANGPNSGEVGLGIAQPFLTITRADPHRGYALSFETGTEASIRHSLTLNGLN